MSHNTKLPTCICYPEDSFINEEGFLCIPTYGGEFEIIDGIEANQQQQTNGIERKIFLILYLSNGR